MIKTNTLIGFLIENMCNSNKLCDLFLKFCNITHNLNLYASPERASRYAPP